MNCNTCISANPINRCAGTLTISGLETPDVNYTVILTDLTTGRKEHFDVIAVGDTVELDVSAIGFMLKHRYSVSAYLDADYNDKVEITLGTETACCVEFDVQDFEPGGDTDEVLSIQSCG